MDDSDNHIHYFPGKQGKIAEYYKKQERLVEGFNEMDTINESGCLPTTLNEVSFFLSFSVVGCFFVRVINSNANCIVCVFVDQDEMKQLARSERMAIYLSNMANVLLFVVKIYASVQSRSLAVIASTLDSLLDLLSGFILWFTSYAMKNPNQYRYPIGKKRMQPVVRKFN